MYSDAFTFYNEDKEKRIGGILLYKKIATYLFVIALMAFALAGCGPSKEVQEALESAESDFE